MPRRNVECRPLCNARGYGLTSQANLLHRGDLHICDDPDATRRARLAPGAWTLFGFHVDRPRLLPETGVIIERSMRVRADRA